MTTAQEIINGACRKIHVLGRGQTLSASDASDGLSALNAMLGSWNIDGAIVFNSTKENFSLSAGVGQYSIGSGQTFNTARPIRINAAFVRYNGFDYPLSKIDEERYSQVYDKDIQGVPSFIYYEDNYPAGNIYIWETPQAAMDLYIYSEKPLTAFSNLTTDVDISEGYEEALIYNLAVRLAPEYEKEPSNTVVKTANESLAAIKKNNSRKNSFQSIPDSVPTTSNRGGYNVYSNQWN